MIITGPVPVPFAPVSAPSPIGAAPPLQIVAVTGVGATSQTSANGDHADGDAGSDTPQKAPPDEKNAAASDPHPQASGESLLGARIAIEETPQDRLAAALSELSARQQARLQAETSAERARSEQDIAILRDMVEVLRTELQAAHVSETHPR